MTAIHATLQSQLNTLLVLVAAGLMTKEQAWKLAKEQEALAISLLEKGHKKCVSAIEAKYNGGE